jgi:hypothetical protein
MQEAHGSATDSDIDTRRIVDTARSGSTPSGWFVWPLRRDQVRKMALGWAAASLLGFVLFVPVVLATIPSNFQKSSTLAVFTVLLIVIPGALAFGGLGLVIADLVRLARADQYLLIMTPDDYVKVEPGRTTRVPMRCVSFVTLKGVKRPDEPERLRPGPQVQLSRVVMGDPFRRPRGQPSLAFLDSCNDREVVVSQDNAFDELPVLEHVLLGYAKGE